MQRMFRILMPLAMALVAGSACAHQAGWRQFTVAPVGDSPPITVALFYPTRAPSRALALGPFTIHVAPEGPPEATTRGLIVFSHGTGGSELAHSILAEALARDGFLVAVPRHPGDNWQDRSLLLNGSGAYFSERPRQVSRVIDALLSDPQWGARIAGDAKGPRIGAVGHSAGGYTVLALGGGEPDPARIASHCRDEARDDPIFCALSGRARVPATAASSTPAGAAATLADPRVRAIVALAPLGVVFTPRSLAAMRVPVALYEAEGDRFLVPRFHAEWIAGQVPGVEMHRVANAWHFAFVDPPTVAVTSEDGDIGADPSGFDRPAFLTQLARELGDFFGRQFP